MKKYIISSLFALFISFWYGSLTAQVQELPIGGSINYRFSDYDGNLEIQLPLSFRITEPASVTIATNNITINSLISANLLLYDNSTHELKKAIRLTKLGGSAEISLPVGTYRLELSPFASALMSGSVKPIDPTPEPTPVGWSVLADVTVSASSGGTLPIDPNPIDPLEVPILDVGQSITQYLTYNDNANSNLGTATSLDFKIRYTTTISLAVKDVSVSNYPGVHVILVSKASGLKVQEFLVSSSEHLSFWDIDDLPRGEYFLRLSPIGSLTPYSLMPGPIGPIDPPLTGSASATVTVGAISSFQEDPTLAATLSSNRNYIHSKTYTTSSGEVYMDQIQYFDGLGRPVQTVQRGVTPNRQDLISIQTYDAFGRDDESWLPGLSSGNGAYVDPVSVKASAQSSAMNNDQKPYSKPVYEASPLNRVLAQYGPGADWHNNGKIVKKIYSTNVGVAAPASLVELDSPDEFSGVVTACDAIVLKPGFHFQSDSEKSMHLYTDPSLCIRPMTMNLAQTQEEQIDPRYLGCTLYKITGGHLTKSGSYAAGQLYVTQISDEDDNRSLEFKDKLGQVVLTRQINGNEKYDTYYVYDDFGNLRYVLPPLAVDKLTDHSDGNEIMKQYAYLYKYDYRNRCIWKKLPGCEPVYYVYDKADRPILTQDGEQRTKGEWAFSLPDAFGRIVLSGTCKNTIDHTANPLGDTIVKAECTAAVNGTHKGYTLSGITLTDPAYLAINYYDNYSFLNKNGFPDYTYDNSKETDYGKQYGTTSTSTEHKGLLTGTMTALFREEDTTVPEYLCSVMFYDIKGQVIQSKSNNHLGGTETGYMSYNFTGQAVKKLHIHTAQGKPTQEELYTYAYDHAGRLTETKHKLNDEPEISLARNEYDELGRLKTKTQNNTTNLNTQYTYNIRSWVTGISNASMYKIQITYNENLGNTPYYNGNISRVLSYATMGNQWRNFSYTYDNLSRLKTVITGGGRNYNATYDYDKHGNMTSLTRYGTIAYNQFGQIDDVSMEYSGNQLVRASDAIANNNYGALSEFKDGTNQPVEYTYNHNGALTKDLNKGITSIRYNSLNLPVEIQVSNETTQGWNKYLYTASGVKLRVESQSAAVTQSAPAAMVVANTYNTQPDKVTDYIGNKVYENGSLKMVLHDEGYYDAREGKYYFYFKDHLGSNRVVTDGLGQAIQQSHYYSFGMSFGDDIRPEKQPYGYNGKEQDKMHGLNMYDYSARHYEPDKGRFTTVDPHAEKYFSWSPYAYCANNPIRITDPTGKDWRDFLNSADEAALETVTSALTSSPIGIAVSAYNLSQAPPEIQEKTLKGMAEGAYTTSVPDFIETAVNEYKSGGDGSVTGNLTGRILAESGMTLATAKPTASFMSVGTAGKTVSAVGQMAKMEGIVAKGITGLKETTKSIGESVKKLPGNIKDATGGTKQWVRVGPSYSYKLGSKTQVSIRWGASPKYASKIGNKTLRNFNQKIRSKKLPGNNWRINDPGHLHIKK